MGGYANQRLRGGFSLIEVLVSVVVMSFGLLALASLQGALMKAGSESRAQSVALSMASEKLEYFTGYRDREEFQALTDGSDAPVTVDGISYTRSWTVERYAYPDAGGTFAAVADTGETAANHVNNNEFKRLEVQVQWTDASGVSQAVALEGALAALSPLDTAKVAKVSSTGGARGPEIIIVNPATEEGVIPIAVGDGSDTAATNPKPEVAGSSTSQRVIETRFDVLTYAALSGDNALAQSRVETVIAGCTCDYGNAPVSSTARGKRPTYWDGLRYVVPEDTTYVPPAGVATSENNQSDLCTTCCRDHHDPAGVAGARFDPRNNAHTMHQYYNPTTGVLGDAAATGTYTEACRLIRVDGIFRVAADAYNDYMNLLATDNDPATAISDYVPTDAATANYQGFVLQYLDDKFVAGTESTYNTVLDPEGTAVLALETSKQLNVPTSPIPIDRPATSSGSSTLKWLHDRGLYIDYLEDEAIQAVNEAKDECEGAGATPTEAELRTCVLKVLPFTTINLTELATWSPQVGTQIVVANNDFRTTLTSDVPVRGKVVPGSKPTHNTITMAVATMGRSNSGLAVLKGPIDAGDAANWSDEQPFQPEGSWDTTEGGAGSGGSFGILLSNYEFTNVYPTFSVTPSATCNPAASGTTRPNPFTCTTQQTGSAQTVTMANYNYQINGTSTADLYCTGGSGPKLYPGSSYTTKTCRNYAVTAVSPSGTWTVANEGRTGETTTISFPVPTTSGFGITFGTPVDTEQTPVCSYNGNGNSLNKFHVETPDCP